MLYLKRNEAALDERLFKSPTAEYRGTPFWAWNGRLDPAILREQIEIFRKMGLGGFHMHVRTGLQDPYLDEAFMDAVAVCVEEAKQKKNANKPAEIRLYPARFKAAYIIRQAPSA